MNKYYIDVEEEQQNGITHWGLVLGNPNPNDDHYIELPSKEKAFELKEKLNNFLREE